MLLFRNNMSHMPITELKIDSKCIRAKVFANKNSHHVTS